MSTVMPNYDLLSDHCAVEFFINCTAEKCEPVKRFRYDLADWDSFEMKLNEAIDVDNVTLDTHLDIDVELQKLLQLISDCMNSSIPKTNHSNGYLRLTPSIKALIAQRNMNKRIYQRTRDPFALFNSKFLQNEIHFQIELNLRSYKVKFRFKLSRF